MLRNTREVSAT